MADREQEMRDRMEADQTRVKIVWDGVQRDAALAFYECLTQLQQAQDDYHQAEQRLVDYVRSYKELEAQLQQAQEERKAAIERRDEWRDRLAASNARESRLNGDIRAAIERGIPLWGWAEVAVRDMNELEARAEAAENALVFDSEADEALTARVLRAEGDAAKQQALAERLRLRITERRAQYGTQMMTVEFCVLGWVLAEIDALAPTEALRAKHRSDKDRTPSTESPQSGQEEGDDD